MKDDPFKPYIDQFRQSLKVRNLARRTIDQTCWKLAKFTVWLIQNHILAIDAITKDAVRSYQVELYRMINAKGRQNSVGYQNGMMAAVKQFTRGALSCLIRQGTSSMPKRPKPCPVAY